jgi:hypothetical protein
MRKPVAPVVVLMLLFAGLGSGALLPQASAQSKKLTALQQAKRIGPKPTPHWYWRWQTWRMGDRHSTAHGIRESRPAQAPRRIPHWAWRRLHFLLLARAQGTAHHRDHKGHAPTSSRSNRVRYEQAISYTRMRPAFTPTRRIDVSNAFGFKAALANLKPGDLVKATAPFTVSGETIVSRRLSSWAVLDLGSYVTFEYSGGQNLPAVYFNNPTHIRIYGGIVTTDRTGGACVSSHGMQDILWWGFYVHDCGGTGVGLAPVPQDGSPIVNNDLQGEITRCGLNLNWDPHAEKGSGLHAVNLDDNGGFAFSGNRFAFYIHDQPSGAGIEYGASTRTNSIPPQHNVIYEKAVNLTFVSHTQTGGNAIQFWGIGGQSADIKYLEVHDVQGYGLFGGGMYTGTTLSNVTVEYGRASNTNLNPRNTGHGPWDSAHGVVYKDVRASS